MDPIINKINQGLHQDNNVYDQPPGTMRDNINGVILGLEYGNFQWLNLKGNSQLELSGSPFGFTADKIMAWCRLRERIFLLTLDDSVSDLVKIFECTFDTDGNLDTINERWYGSNDELEMSHDHPIRSMWGIFEDDKIQRVYWTDWNKQPRSINLKDESSVSLDPKFVDFFPVINKCYGNFQLNNILAGGNCKAGSYFFAWRLYKEGYYTDWSYTSHPVHVTSSNNVDTFDGYQDFQGNEPDEDVNKKIRIDLADLDTDYDSIQICAFYSNDYNSAQAGVIFYDGDITASTMTLDFLGSENLGSVTIDDLIETSVLIEKCKDMRHIKKWNVIAGITEREELDVSSIHPEGKNNQMNVDIEPFVYSIPLDTTGYPYGGSWTPGNKALFGIKTGASEGSNLMHNVWYRALSAVQWTDDNGTNNASTGEYFRPVATTGPASLDSGTVYQAIVVRKYRKAGAGNPPDINTDYQIIGQDVYWDYYTYKNSKVNGLLRGYPSNELIRLAVVFFDKTGRPFYARWLNNTNATYGVPNSGDTKIPRRTQGGNDWDLIFYNDNIGSNVFEQVSGNLIGLKVSGLDITPIKDRIGGFSIVRAPIIRENIAYGVLANLYQDGNDIYQYPGFRNYNSDTNKYKGAYAFYCPEDIYQFRGFSIQPGDKIVNHEYYRPFDPTVTPQTNFQGYGREDMTGTEGNYSFYQKYYRHNDTATPDNNGVLDVDHDVLYYTRHEMGDTDKSTSLAFDPSDPTKELMGYSATVSSRIGFNTNLGILVLDIDEVTDGNKGYTNLATTDPKILVCSVKRDNSSPYGGSGDSSLANSLYISTGHYQHIDSAVLSDIQSGDSYIFNDIDVFGGDSYVCLFDICRLMKNEDSGGVGDRFGQSIIVPLETRMNIELREGNHIGKDRSYDSVNNPTGIRRKIGGQNWEEFYYNDGYSTDNIEDYYLPLPYNFQLQNEFDTRFRFSDTKNYNELEDSFRKFSALNFIDLDTYFGPVNNIRRKSNRMVYWQRDAVGYIPIQERALTQNAFGDPVQLGVGGIFERFDEIIDMVGNSNQFGLVESPAGFHWYDSIRKAYLTLDNGLKFTSESLIKGLDQLFTNEIPQGILGYDNPISSYGILSGYDPYLKIVFTTFFAENFNKTIGYNTKNGKFAGTFNFYPRMYFDYRNFFYAVDNDRTRMFLMNSNENRGRFFGTDYDAYLTLVIKDDSNLAKIFDNFEIIANENFLEYAGFENSEQGITETILGTRNASFRNRRWYGNFPLVNRERFVDGYLKVTFRIPYGTNEATFNEMKTFVRQMI